MKVWRALVMLGFLGVVLTGCSKQQEAVQNTVIEHTQGQLKEMKKDVKEAEEMNKKAFQDAEKSIGKDVASE